jgi:hypothetical protein
VHGQVEGGDHLCPTWSESERAIERSPYASSSLFTATPHSEPLHLRSQRGTIDDRVRAARDQVGLIEDLLQPLGGHEREQRLAHRRAVRGQAGADVQVEVDLALARPGVRQRSM